MVFETALKAPNKAVSFETLHVVQFEIGAMCLATIGCYTLIVSESNRIVEESFEWEHHPGDKFLIECFMALIREEKLNIMNHLDGHLRVDSVYIFFLSAFFRAVAHNVLREIGLGKLRVGPAQRSHDSVGFGGLRQLRMDGAWFRDRTLHTRCAGCFSRTRTRIPKIFKTRRGCPGPRITETLAAQRGPSRGDPPDPSRVENFMALHFCMATNQAFSGALATSSHPLQG
jgi:hypothetical protein